MSAARDRMLSDMESTLFKDHYYGDMFRAGQDRKSLADALLVAGWTPPGHGEGAGDLPAPTPQSRETLQ